MDKQNTSELPDKWQKENNSLYRKFVFIDFAEAFHFMQKAAIEAEQMKHHPTWTNVYNKVEIWLSTHDAGDVITEKDYELANRINAII